MPNFWSLKCHAGASRLVWFGSLPQIWTFLFPTSVNLESLATHCKFFANFATHCQLSYSDSNYCLVVLISHYQFVHYFCHVGACIILALHCKIWRILLHPVLKWPTLLHTVNPAILTEHSNPPKSLHSLSLAILVWLLTLNHTCVTYSHTV